jgi:hypothetical protein
VNIITRSWIRIAILITILTGAAFQVACITPDRDGLYRDASGAVSLELKAGKATLTYGGIRIEGTFTVDSDKLTIKPTVGNTTQTMVFTINSDGSIDGPPGSEISKLKKVK